MYVSIRSYGSLRRRECERVIHVSASKGVHDFLQLRPRPPSPNQTLLHPWATKITRQITLGDEEGARRRRQRRGGRSRLAEFDKHGVNRVERSVDLFTDLGGQR